MSETTDYSQLQLLNDVAGGDEQAFRKLFELYQAYVFSAAFRVLKDPAVAEEVTQDVFLRIWQKRSLLTGIRHFPAFLFKVTENFIYPALRSQVRGRVRKEKFLEQDSQVSLLPDDYSSKEYDQVLRHAVDNLPARQKETFLLVREGGLKRNEVARRLQVSDETVKSNLDQAVRKIRAFCEKRMGFHGLLIAFLLLA